MISLANVFRIKIAATLLLWCAPLMLAPGFLLTALGLPEQENYMFIRLLGWAYLSLCVGYWFGLNEALAGRYAPGPVWVGILSNGGACAYLLYFGLTGTWSSWGFLMQATFWFSIVATALLALGLNTHRVRHARSATQPV